MSILIPAVDSEEGIPERRVEVRSKPDPSSLSARVGGRSAGLVDLSRGGLAIRVPSAPSNECDQLDLELLHNDVAIARVALAVTHRHAAGEEVVLGGRIAHCELVTSGKSPLPRSGDVVEVRDPTLRARVLERLRARGSRATAHFDCGRTVEVTLGAASTDAEALAIRAPELETDGMTRFVSVEVFHFRSLFVLEAEARPAGDEWVFVEPCRVLSVCRRQAERVPISPETGVLRFADVLDPEHSVEARIIDLSPHGLAVELPEGCFLPPPPIPATIRIGEQRFRVLAEAHRMADAPSTRIVGLRIKMLREADLLRFTRLYEALRFPNLHARRDVPVAAVNELLERSGYLALRDGTTPSGDWHASPGDESLAVDTVFRAQDGSALGHFSIARLYPRTWILHQLATLGLRRANIAYPLYLHLMDWITALTSGESYAIAYFDQERSWHRALFGEFVRWVGSEAQSLIFPLDRFEPCAAPPSPPVLADGMTLRHARPEELVFAKELARSKLPPLLADALHLRDDSLATTNLCREHTMLGLDRSRSTLVVEARGELLGVAVCETGSRHLSLFNLLNFAYLFFREPLPPAVARSAQVQLFREVAKFYAARGHQNPLIVTPAGSAPFARGAGFTRAETMGAWAASFEGIKQWRNYLHFRLGELVERKRSRAREAA